MKIWNAKISIKIGIDALNWRLAHYVYINQQKYWILKTHTSKKVFQRSQWKNHLIFMKQKIMKCFSISEFILLNMLHGSIDVSQQFTPKKPFNNLKLSVICFSQNIIWFTKNISDVIILHPILRIKVLVF